MGACHVQRCMKPLLERIQRGDIDPTFIITHIMPLDEAAKGDDTCLNKEDECMKVILKAS